MSRDDISDVAKYYSINDEDARIQRQQLEFILTGFLLKHYLPPQSSIVELGSGSGQYTLALAEDGHKVTAVELAPNLVEKSKQRCHEQKNITHICGDARDISQLTHDTFDVALAMGPFYHLVHAEDRYQLMSDLKARLKPGGVLISAHLSRLGFYSYMLANHSDWILKNRVLLHEMTSNGFIESVPRTGVFRGYYTTIDEIQKSHQSAGYDLEAIHSQDPCIGGADILFNKLNDNLKLQWAEELFSISGTPLAWGSGRTLLCIARKP